MQPIPGTNSIEKVRVNPILLLRFIVGCLLLSIVNTSFAIDEGGCLTCHQFPGLVRHEKDDGFKVLHIDETKYLKSPHGKIDCRKCHTEIAQVPHTGENRVDCTTNCHLTEKDKLLVKKYPLGDLHKTEQSFIVSLKDESACGVCHQLYPHSDNKLVRALLNMHTGFLRCEVCHLKKENFPAVTYDWKDTENAVFSGEPFGTYYNPKTQKAHKSKHFISRIAIFEKNNEKKQLLFNSGDSRKASEFQLSEQQLDAGQKAEGLNYFHRDIAKKEISVACDDCHSSRGILDFQQLGFDEKTAANLISLNIKGLVTKYKIFYFPDLFSD